MLVLDRLPPSQTVYVGLQAYANTANGAYGPVTVASGNVAPYSSRSPSPRSEWCTDTASPAQWNWHLHVTSW
jgi:hypothetical protein